MGYRRDLNGELTVLLCRCLEAAVLWALDADPNRVVNSNIEQPKVGNYNTSLFN